jgi:hypothetical protein
MERGSGRVGAPDLLRAITGRATALPRRRSRGRDRAPVRQIGAAISRLIAKHFADGCEDARRHKLNRTRRSRENDGVGELSRNDSGNGRLAGRPCRPW